MNPRSLAAGLCALLLSQASFAARFTYHGDLLDGDAPAEGRYDFRLRALAAPAAKAALAAPAELTGVEVVQGRFTVEFDLPESAGAFTWIEVAVRGAQGEYEVLGEPQPVAKVNSACPGAWALDGNTGVPAGSFLGLADPLATTPLQLHVMGARVAEFAPAPVNHYGNSPSVTMGSSANVASAAGATVSGGGATFLLLNNPCPTCRNAATGSFATVGGGHSNQASDGAATIAGGTFNQASGIYSTVAGGTSNQAIGVAGATIGGGSSNLASGLNATVSGGADNEGSGETSAVAGGKTNVASGKHAAIAGGKDNLANGIAATVGGGVGNTAAGENSFAAGSGSCAGGDYSIAIGRNARTRYGGEPGDATCPGFDIPTFDGNGDAGSFVFADDHEDIFRSSGDNQFLVRAGGGVGINTAPPTHGEIELTVETDADGIDYANLWLKQKSFNENGVLLSVGDGSSNNAGFYIDHYNGSAQFRRMELLPDGTVNIRSNATAANTGVTVAANSGSWSSLSDRHVKTAIVAVDAVDILDRLMALPISIWSYTAQGTGIRHVGPMAQDFAAAFGLGENDTTIATIDADGIALAAIQGLNRRLSDENATLRARLDALEARLDALESAR